MSDETDKANHDAKQKVADHLEEVQGKIENEKGEPEITDNEHVENKKLGNTSDKQKEWVRDEIEEAIEEILQEVNRNDIVKADCLMRKLRRTLKRRMTDSDKRTEMFKLLVLARKAKRKITDPAALAFRDELDDLPEDFAGFGISRAASFAPDAPISAIAEISGSAEEALASALSIETVEDLATHPAIALAMQVMEAARRRDC